MSWRDNTESSVDIVRDGKHFRWEHEDIQKLREMFEQNRSQVEILRAFPNHNWKALVERYRYHFGTGKWLSDFTGEVRYSLPTKWQDTDEYQAEPSRTHDRQPMSYM